MTDTRTPHPILSHAEMTATVRIVGMAAHRLMAGNDFANATERKFMGTRIAQLCDLLDRADAAGCLFGPKEG